MLLDSPVPLCPQSLIPNLPSFQLVDVPEMEYYASQGQGEVCVQGANVFKGYFKEPEKTREVIDQDGWHHTGDVGKWLPVRFIFHFKICFLNVLCIFYEVVWI